MRFITEFERDGTRFDATPAIVDHRKELRQSEMGAMIARNFGWSTKGFTKSYIGAPAQQRWTLEIEAFPMDKWIEFKQRLLEYVKKRPGDVIGVLQILKDVEFCVKPITDEQSKKGSH
jgi:hypothetical protein